MSGSNSVSRSTETPSSGIAGFFKHWRNDVWAGLVVSLISLPLSLGIAVASGAPPIAGLIAAIVAGIIAPILGGTWTTISGPAAGLAPILFALAKALGRGDPIAGYPLLFMAIMAVGILQIIFAYFKLARIVEIFPSSVEKGMLCAIGLLVSVKQIPLLIGCGFSASSFWGILREAPVRIFDSDGNVLLISSVSLVMIISLLQFKDSKLLKSVPPYIIVAVSGLVLGLVVGLDRKFLVQLPENPMDQISQVSLPNFGLLFASVDLDLILTWFGAVLTLKFIDGIEGTATAFAVDKVDPYRRKSDPNRVLLTMGVSNFFSSLLGGLTIIPEGLRSKACIDAGGKTLWANGWVAVFLCLYLFVGNSLVSLLPLGVIGAIVVAVGFTLCQPKKWTHAWSVGKEQFLVFCVTVLVTISTDLLLGVVAGVLTELLVCAWFVMSHCKRVGAKFSWVKFFRGIFKDPVIQRLVDGGECHVHLNGLVVCFNRIGSVLDQLPKDVQQVHIHFEQCFFIDPTSYAQLVRYSADHGNVKFHGIEELEPMSSSPLSARFRTSYA